MFFLEKNCFSHENPFLQKYFILQQFFQKRAKNMFKTIIKFFPKACNESY